MELNLDKMVLNLLNAGCLHILYRTKKNEF